MEIKHIKGSENVGADKLSRNYKIEEIDDTPVLDLKLISEKQMDCSWIKKQQMNRCLKIKIFNERRITLDK